MAQKTLKKQKQKDSQDEFEIFIESLSIIFGLLKNLGVPYPKISFQFPIIFHIGGSAIALHIAKKNGLYTEENRIAFVINSLDDIEKVISQIVVLKTEVDALIKRKEDAISPSVISRIKGFFGLNGGDRTP